MAFPQVATDFYWISGEVEPFTALCSQEKPDPVKSPVGMLGGPGLWVSLTQAERQAAAYVTGVM